MNCKSIKLFLSVPEPESWVAFGQLIIFSKSTLPYTAWRLFVWEWESLFPPLTAFESFHGPVGQLQAAATRCRVVLDDDWCSVLTFEPQLKTRHNGIVSCLVAATAAALVWQHGNLYLVLPQGATQESSTSVFFKAVEPLRSPWMGVLWPQTQWGGSGAWRTWVCQAVWPCSTLQDVQSAGLLRWTMDIQDKTQRPAVKMTFGKQGILSQLKIWPRVILHICLVLVVGCCVSVLILQVDKSLGKFLLYQWT